MSSNEQHQRATTDIRFSHSSTQREGEAPVEYPDSLPPVVTFRAAESKRAA